MFKSVLCAALLWATPVMAQTWNIDAITRPTDSVRTVSTVVKLRLSVDSTTPRRDTTVRIISAMDTTYAALPLTGRGVKVAILDNGVDQTNPTLRPAGGIDITTNVTTPSAWNEGTGPCQGHSTHVYGVVRQIAPEADILAVKVSRIISGNCYTYSTDLANAINWAVANGAKVLVISKWVPAVGEITTAIQNAIAANVVIVAAAGNSGISGLTFPASAPGVIAVGSVGRTNIVSIWSSVGPQLLVVAPGEDIVSSVPVNTTGSKSGTSHAAPHVAGIVTLLLQAVPTATPAQIADALCKGATDIMPLGRDNMSGCGLVNGARALQRLRNP